LAGARMHTDFSPKQVGPLGAILLPGPVLLTGMLALQAVLPSDVVNAGLFLAAPLAAAAAVQIARPPGRLHVAGFAMAAFLWTLLMLILIGLAALAIATA
jgi:divalent metal cation (Fe/Co/Zn/Cd) transporter